MIVAPVTSPRDMMGLKLRPAAAWKPPMPYVQVVCVLLTTMQSPALITIGVVTADDWFCVMGLKDQKYLVTPLSGDTYQLVLLALTLSSNRDTPVMMAMRPEGTV